MAGKKVLFIGDLTARSVFMQSLYTSNSSLTDFPSIEERKGDWTVISNNITYSFIWDPFLNGNGFEVLKNLAINRGANHNNWGFQFIYIAFGRHFALDNENSLPNVEKLSKFKEAVEKVAPFLESVAGSKPTDGNPAPKVIVSPVMEPLFEKAQNNVYLKGLTPLHLDTLNKHLLSVFPLATSKVYLPSVFNMLSWGRQDSFGSDGDHLVPYITAVQSDIIHNMACNTEISTDFPYANTCCLKYPEPSGLYFLLLWASVLVVPLCIIIYYSYTHWGASIAKTILNAESALSFKVHMAFVGLSLGLLYSFTCDRTNVFAKGNKYFLVSEFWGLTLIALLLGSVTTKRILDPKKPQGQVQQATFLNRFQTDEWKGWMQVIILIYHITGASKNLPIYKAIRIMVAAYLFMTGYGHATFFVSKGDFSFKRFVSVMCRLNLLTIGLAYVMNTNYLFYYFSPLVSFWFCIIWLTFRILPQFNSKLVPSLVKVSLSGVVSYCLIALPGFLELVFWFLGTFLRISWDLREWRFRVLLDIWAVHFGMVVSILVHNPELSGVYSRIFEQAGHTTRSLLGILSGIVLIVIYWNISVSYTVKAEYNEVHKVISLLPILGIVLIRNAMPFVNFYSTFFAWIGRISLETFIMQFHVWMAADTKGVLYMIDMGLSIPKKNFVYTQGLGNSSTYAGSLRLFRKWAFGAISKSYMLHRYLNFILTTAVFLIISQEIATASGVLTVWYVTPEKLQGGNKAKERSTGPKAGHSGKNEGAEKVKKERDEEGEMKDLQEGEGVSVNVDPDTVASKTQSVEMVDLEAGHEEKSKESGGKEAGESVGNSDGPGGPNVPIVYSTVGPIRICQKLYVMGCRLTRDLPVRVGVTIACLCVVNLLW